VLKPVASEDGDISEPVAPTQSSHDAVAVCVARHKPFSSVWSVSAPLSTLLHKSTCPVLDRYALEPEIVSLQQQKQQQCDVHHLGVCTLILDNTYCEVHNTPPQLQCPQQLVQQPREPAPEVTAVPSAVTSRYTQVVYGFVFVGVVVVVVVGCGKLFFRVVVAVVETAIKGMLNELHAGGHVQVVEVQEPHLQELEAHALEVQVSSNCDTSHYSAHAW
jgi:hypothetical protein